MSYIVWKQLEFILRIMLAGLCGAIIGYERKNRNKEAGIRTHLIVAMGAALIMIVSKYGFNDILGHTGIALDPSRIAAQIVTGVGFLGAGMIFMRRNMIRGLTTAAGIWATSGIGMAIGSGLYVVGIVTTVFIVLVQIVLHSKHRWAKESYKEEMTFLIEKDKAAVEDLKKRLEHMGIEILNVSIGEEESGYHMKLVVAFPDGFNSADFMSAFHTISYIKEMDV